MNQPVNSTSFGLKWGGVISAVYLVLLFMRYHFGADSFFAFSGLTFLGYVIVLVLLFLAGYRYRTEHGGWAEMKEIFKVLFICVLIFEFCYMLFTVLYLKYIDPSFFDKLRASTERILIASKQSQTDIDKAMENLKLMKQQSLNINLFDFIKSYLTYVGVTGLFAFLFAFILKRKPEPFQQNQFPQP